jgi:regulator of protease activity HflC (stomatin/prohibitin superfamily)
MRLVDLRTVTVDVPPQDVITKDSVSVRVDAVLYYRIVDPVKSAMSVVNHPMAIDLASLTTLRSVIGQHELDALLKSRDAIDSTLRTLIGSIAEPWGIKVEMVDIRPSTSRQTCNAPWPRKPKPYAKSERASSKPKRKKKPP